MRGLCIGLAAAAAVSASGCGAAAGTGAASQTASSGAAAVTAAESTADAKVTAAAESAADAKAAQAAESTAEQKPAVPGTPSGAESRADTAAASESTADTAAAENTADAAAASVPENAGAENAGGGPRGGGMSGNREQEERTVPEREVTPLEELYTEEDLDESWDEKKDTSIVLDGTSAEINGSGASFEDGTLTIDDEGTYVLSGKLDGQVLITAGKKKTVHLVLNGVEIRSDSTAAVNAEKAGKVILTLADGTVNTLEDAETYVYPDEETDDPDAALFVKNSLTINGNGLLKITAHQKGIHAKDDLLILSGCFEINSADDAFNGKDSVTVADGDFAVNVTDPETGKGITSRGPVRLYDGSMEITASNEGIEGLTVEVFDGEWYITSSDDGINAREKTESSEDETAAAENTAAEVKTAAPAETVPAGQDNTGFPDGTDGQGFPGGAGGKGFPGGADGQGFPGGMSEEDFAAEAAKMEYNEKCAIIIYGGKVVVNASGDGLDSNGDLIVEGGEVYVSSSEGNGDAALDMNGAGLLNGGTVLALGSAGMLEMMSSNSEQPFVTAVFSATAAAGSEVSVTDGSGKEILSWTAPKAFGAAVISSGEFKEGETYTVTCGEEKTEVTISGISTVSGVTGQGFGMRGGFGPGGGMRGGFGPQGGEGMQGGGPRGGFGPSAG